MPSAIATWEDESKNRFVLLPVMGAKSGVAAFKVNGHALEQAWTSSTALASPSAPIVVNGVVFALNQGAAGSPAVLYAFNGETGQEIWNSGTTLKSYVRSGLWPINGEVHVVTADNTIYAFGAANGRHL
jgi:outer membrane protein assembly factor BamB